MERHVFRILLVEDNLPDARLVEEALRDVPDFPTKVKTVTRLEEATQLLDGEEKFDIVLLDLSLPDSHGLETVTNTQQHAAAVPIVVLTGLDDESTGMAAVRQGAQDYLIKGQTEGRLLVRAMRYAVERKRLLDERDRLITELTEALGHVKRLSGLLPICASCKKIRDDRGYWMQVEQYLDEHADITFSHALCPECVRKLYSDYFKDEEE